jgi:hypothetical protein
MEVLGQPLLAHDIAYAISRYPKIAACGEYSLS